VSADVAAEHGDIVGDN